MIRKIITSTVLVAIGYVIGVHFGFKAAVHDYTENGARVIEQVAEESSASDEDDEMSVADLFETPEGKAFQ